MEFIVLAVVFIAVTALSWILLPAYIAYTRKLKEEEANLSDYDRARKRSLLGKLKPLFHSIVEQNKKIRLSARWLEANRQRWNTILAKAGSPGNIDGEEFLAFKQLAPIVVFIILSSVLGVQSLGLVILLSIFSFYLPDLWLNDLVKTKHIIITRNLPDVLDTLALIVGAGVNFDEAIDVYINTTQGNPLQEEFSLVRSEIRLGKSRHEALRSMAERLDCEAITNFTRVTIESEQMGTPLANALNTQVEVVRKKRYQTAEQKGQLAPIKMLAPLLLLIMPNVFIVLFAPMILKMIYS